VVGDNYVYSGIQNQYFSSITTVNPSTAQIPVIVDQHPAKLICRGNLV